MCRFRGQAALVFALSFPMAATPVILSFDVEAQARSEALEITAPSTFLVPPSSEMVLPIQVAPAFAIPPRAIVLIRGLPSTIALSEGRLFESGVWAVGASALSQLKITSSSVAAGRNNLSISLVALDGTLLAEAKSELVIGEQTAMANTAVTMPDNSVLTAAPPQRTPKLRDEERQEPKHLTADQTEQLLAMVKKGDEQMSVGNISAARLLYAHAAENGLAAGALALAGTYDEQELGKHRVMGGVQADQQKAQFWYEKARELGSAEARERLQRLGSR